MKYILFIFLVLLLACKNRPAKTFAQITERRSDTSGRLVIVYRFYTGEQWVQDSTVIMNQVLPQDSLMLVFAPENPRENQLLLP